MALRFLPSGRAHLGGHGPGFRVPGGVERRPAHTTRIDLERNRGRLAHQSLIDHALRDGLPELDGQFLQVGELGPPGHALRTVDPVNQLFGDTLEKVLQL